MRDYHLQTQQKDHSAAIRRPKSALVPNKKPSKVYPKNTNSAFSPCTEDDLGFDSPKDWIDSSSVAEISDWNLVVESSEESSVSLTPASAITSEAVVSSEISPSSSVINLDEPKDGTTSSISQNETASQEVAKLLSSVEAEVLIKCLKDAQVQVSESKNMDLCSKKLLDALVKIYAVELFQSPVEKDWFDLTMWKKGSLAVLLLLLWTIAMFAVLFNFSDSKYIGSIPS